MTLRLARPPVHMPQRDDGDCTITSLAMAFGLRWEEVAARTGTDICNPKEGCSDYGGALIRLGLTSDDFMIFNGYEHAGTSQDFFNSLFWRRPALLTVESRVVKGGMHSIYYDGTNIYDPAPHKRQRFKSVENLPVCDFVIFRHDL